jgi:hypothetical protein
MSQTQSLSEVRTPRLLFSYGAGDGESRRSERYLAQVLRRRVDHDAFAAAWIDPAERPDLAQWFRIGETQVRGRLERPGNAVEIQCLLTPWLR